MPRPLQSKERTLEKLNDLLNQSFDVGSGSLRVDFVVSSAPDPVTTYTVFADPLAKPGQSEETALIKINNYLNVALMPSGRLRAVAC